METLREGFQTVGEGIYAHLTSGVVMMSNAAIVSGDRCALMFDTFITVGLTETFLAEYAAVSDSPIRYLVLSHAHGDHCHGAHAVKGTQIIGHRGIRAAIDMYSRRPIEEEQRAFPHLDLTGARFTYPTVYTDGNISVDLGGRTVDILYNGKCHTDHDLMAYVPDAGTVLCGDVLFNGICPVCNTADLDNYEKVLRFMLRMDADTFVPGHGPVSGKDAVEELLLYITTLKTAVERICAGAQEREAVDAAAFARFARGWKESYRFFESLEAQVAARQGRVTVIRFDAKRAQELQKKADAYVRAR